MEYAGELEGRKVLVTGANGCIGSNLVKMLVEHGSDVLAFVEAGCGHQNLENVLEDIEVFRGDLTDFTSVQEAIQLASGHEVFVFHLGAQAHVGQSWERPYQTVRTNVIGTLNLLEALRIQDVDVEKFNTAGTSEEYGNIDGTRKQEYRNGDKGVVLDEKAPINPESVYGTSKVAADFLTRNYHEAYGLPTITTRMFNNYGPRQHPSFITSKVITRALENQRVELGNLEPKRDMCYVEDGVRGHIHATVAGEPGEVYTYGYGESMRMRDWVELILETGEEQGYWQDVEIIQKQELYRPGDSDVRELRAGYGKLNDLTGWEPRVPRKEGVRRTIEWYAGNREKWVDHLC